MVQEIFNGLKSILLKIINFPKEVFYAFIAPFRVYKFLKNMLREGFYEITTDFEFEGNPYQFRTLIQPDADIINYIPDIAKHTKKKWLETFRKEYQNHIENIEFFLQRATESQLALSRLIDTGIITGNGYPIWQFIEQLSIETAGISGATLALSVAFRKFLKPYIVKLSLRGIFRLARVYFRKKLS